MGFSSCNPRFLEVLLQLLFGLAGPDQGGGGGRGHSRGAYLEIGAVADGLAQRWILARAVGRSLERQQQQQQQ